MAFIEINPSFTKVLVFRGKDILTDSEGKACAVQCDRPDDCFLDSQTGISAAEAGASYEVPDGYRFITLREYFSYASEEDVAVAGRMRGYLNWRASYRFCPFCATPLSPHPIENSLVCPSCGRIHYPRISPCIIAVIDRGEEILLLRHRQRNQDIYACLAGFVEAGESLEHALRREVREETGLEICNIRYAGSQSWPFPDQLMVGFYADYLSGDIRIQEDEITEARWFRRDDIPASPRPGSISYKLIHRIVSR